MLQQRTYFASATVLLVGCWTKSQIIDKCQGHDTVNHDTKVYRTEVS